MKGNTRRRFALGGTKAAVWGLSVLTLVFGMSLALAGCGGDDGGDDDKKNVTDPNKVATPTADPAAGEVAGGTEITLACATEGADIYYTLDGSDPTASSTKYGASSKPKITAANKTLKAFAVLSGKTDSDVLTAEYTITPAKWVIGGRGATILSSVDGVTWNKLTDEKDTNPFHFTLPDEITSRKLDVRGVAYSGGIWVAVGNNQYYSKIATSTDGNTWTPVTQTVFSSSFSDSGHYVRGVAYNNGKWIAVGQKGRIATSTNGTSWEAVTASVITNSNNLENVTGSGPRWFIKGDSYYTSSDNGVNWTSFNFNAVQPSAGVAYNGSNLWLGYRTITTTVTSPDGATWTNLGDSSGIGFQPFNIAFGGSTWVAVGGDGKIATSTNDGASWAQVSDSSFGTSSNDIYCVAFGNGKFVAVGEGGKVATSTNGTTWVQRTSDVTTNLYVVAYKGE